MRYTSVLVYAQIFFHCGMRERKRILRTGKTKKIAIAASLTVMVAILLFFFDPNSTWYAPKCPIKLLTGLSCPACGIQRFIHAILHGNFTVALQFNYWLVVIFPYAIAFLVAWSLPESKVKVQITKFIENPIVVGIYIASMVIWTIVRNILGI